MKNNIILSVFILFAFSCCTKEKTVIQKQPSTTAVASGFSKYIIKKGAQFANENAYLQTNYSELKFIVKFDSSAIYKSITPENQFDINKLYGFADNNSGHQQFSARFGWRWSDNALRLFGYVYNNGVRDSKEIAVVNIGAENNCSIKISAGSYIFSINGKTETLPRTSTIPTAIGYKLYPYFGGDEYAPHDIFIWIKEL